MSDFEVAVSVDKVAGRVDITVHEPQAVGANSLVSTLRSNRVT